jgi:hypothetical protein
VGPFHVRLRHAWRAARARAPARDPDLARDTGALGLEQAGVRGHERDVRAARA